MKTFAIVGAALLLALAALAPMPSLASDQSDPCAQAASDLADAQNPTTKIPGLPTEVYHAGKYSAAGDDFEACATVTRGNDSAVCESFLSAGDAYSESARLGRNVTGGVFGGETSAFTHYLRAYEDYTHAFLLCQDGAIHEAAQAGQRAAAETLNHFDFSKLHF
ncbi:MAG: hypothetical protein WCE44_10250 [Candidatus Velthaea sp.]